MQLLISRSQILDNLCRQIDSFFSCTEEECSVLEIYLDKALERVKKCFQGVGNKYFKAESGGEIQPLSFSTIHDIPICFSE